ncbi:MULTISPECIES: D-ribose pyranase [Enterobacteriaceae]|uniref:D-ribose pyranase n=1 Tax=Kluyvera genomosp. 2 TaxID=2774054 RepID=A0A2T2Y6E7_9ENTR|nr:MULTISPECIES: D-ribose pyranase [Enterobacteriaceae]HAT3917404.1 D-ribose pyranase [Kluyvera ascorbata]PSR48100.1 D-ribose pyranase [Kluyvera genomosp. 2]BBQ84693.1 L-fucose mutarotase [Klebsiella sp. WP3-W18-ESBL-02]BBR21743.1 L-fucose mutarotase [Klebsiella sp. WP3-S18-ESBL-05]BBR58146.1 L-fucose mutarotase [Klebsiella sp. WP4-W18-ESBL-05]
MRTGRIQHPELAGALATLGHTDIVLVTDAGFPIPANAHRIDLGFWPGTIDVMTILQVLREEIFVEEVHFASEVRDCNPQLYRDLQAVYTGSGAEFREASHETLCQQLAQQAKVIIRSGSFNPWANFALVASTDPFAWFTDASGVAPLPAYVARRQRILDNVVPELN